MATRILMTVCVLLAAFLPANPDNRVPAPHGVSGFDPSWNGTMMPYDFAVCDTAVPWDSTMHPVFADYVARHGARYLSSAKKTGGLHRILSEAESRGTLSRSGREFLKLLERVDSVTDGQWGALDPLGIYEEKRLADGLDSIMPQLLSSGRIDACSTYVPRVVMTMYTLCHRLAQLSPNLEIHTVEGKQLDPLLRFFDTDTAYVSYLKVGDWVQPYRTFADSVIPVGPAQAMLLDIKGRADLQRITMQVYGVVQSLAAAGIETDLSQWFTPEEYRACWEVDNLHHYFQRSANRWSALPAQAAKPLLQRFVSEADKAFDAAPGEDHPVASMFFGHAETVMPLFALMQLPGCYAPDCTPEEVSSQWRDFEVSPLGANLLMVCLRDPYGACYVSLRLNGRWLEMFGTKTIPWETLRSFWTVAE